VASVNGDMQKYHKLAEIPDTYIRALKIIRIRNFHISCHNLQSSQIADFIWISKKKTPNPYKKWGFIIQPWQSPRVYRWLKCERFVFQYQIGYLDVKLIITGLPRPPWRYLPPTRNLIAKKDVFLRTAKIVMFRCARLNDLKKWINLPPSRDIWVYRRLQGVVVRINQKGRGDSPSGTNRPRGNRNRMEFRHSTCLIMLSAMWFQRFSFFSQNEGAIPAPQLESPLYQKVWSVPYCRYR